MKRFPVAIAACFLLCNCTSQTEKPTISGKVLVAAEPDTYVAFWLEKKQPGKPCIGGDAARDEHFDDIKRGAKLVVKDGSGKQIATGQLDRGKIVPAGSFGACELPLTIPDVPAADSYTIQLGNHSVKTYSAKDLQQKDWKIELSFKPTR